MIKYLLRLIIYLAIFFAVFSVSSVMLSRFVPVTITPLKVVRLKQNLLTNGPLVYSKWVSLEGISPNVFDAVVATEDNHFTSHSGFDWEAIELAWKQNRDGGKLRGASTITQQTAKNVFCYPSRNWFRKGVETYYTALIEVIWGKKRIMEVYLNVIETGPNRYGVEAVARKVYGKTAAELNVYEASMIATILPNPLKMDIANPSNYMVRRAERVRLLMKKIDKVEFD